MKTLPAVALACLISNLSYGMDGNTVFPPTHDIFSSYSLSSDHIAVSDTFAITRTLINHESFPLSGLYFLDNLPQEFIIVDQSFTINGVPSPFLEMAPTLGLVAEGKIAYYWIIDSLGNFEGIDLVIDPHDIAVLELKLVCNLPGHYSLPIQTATFFGINTGFFATSEPLQVVVTQPVNVHDDAPVHMFESRLVSKAFPNPFNPMVTIHFIGDRIAGEAVVFSIFDLSGKLIQRINLLPESDAGQISWRPDDSVSSGVYLYRIAHDGQATGGKLVLLK